jgi:uncharacterized CHY-type Zn-finger protein
METSSLAKSEPITNSSIILFHPELVTAWHPTKNGNLSLAELNYNCRERFWWLCPDCGREYMATLSGLIKMKGRVCTCNPFAPQMSHKFLDIDEKKKSLAYCSPEIAAEWHYIRNKPLTPEEIPKTSTIDFWWICAVCKHEWSANVFRRVHGQGCPQCRQKRTEKNLLINVIPGIADVWHPTRNGLLTPGNLTYGSESKAWLLCPRCGHEWQKKVYSLIQNSKCPNCFPFSRRRGRAKKFSRTAILYVIRSEWNFLKNGDLIVRKIFSAPNRIVWWQCRHCGHQWHAKISDRISNNANCPNCHKHFF